MSININYLEAEQQGKCTKLTILKVFIYLLIFATWGTVIATSAYLLNQDDVFRWHPILMGTAVLLLLPLAMLTHWLPVFTMDSNQRRSFHGALNYTMVFFLCIGFLFVFFHKKYVANESTIPVGTHARLGVAFLGLVALQTIMGIFKYLCLPDRPAILRYHPFIGWATFLLGLITVAHGVHYKFGRLSYTDPATGDSWRTWLGNGVDIAIYVLIGLLGLMMLIGRAWVGETEVGLTADEGIADDSDLQQILVVGAAARGV